MFTMYKKFIKCHCHASMVSCQAPENYMILGLIKRTLFYLTLPFSFTFLHLSHKAMCCSSTSTRDANHNENRGWGCGKLMERRKMLPWATWFCVSFQRDQTVEIPLKWVTRCDLKQDQSSSQDLWQKPFEVITGKDCQHHQRLSQICQITRTCF